MLALTGRRITCPWYVHAFIASLACVGCVRVVNNRSTLHPSSGYRRKQRHPVWRWHAAPAVFALSLGATLHPDPVEAAQFARTFASDRGYGGEARLAQATADGGFIVTGVTSVPGPTRLEPSALVLKLDSRGNAVWSRRLSYTGDDFAAASVEPTLDGGFVLVGHRGSFNTATNLRPWVAKVDTGGVLVWIRNYAGTGDDGATCMTATSDGGFIVAGWSRPAGGPRMTWVMKLNSNGITTWQRTYGSGEASSVHQSADGNYIVAVASQQRLMKLDAAGTIVWQKSYGGSGEGIASVAPTPDGGYIAAGHARAFGAGGGSTPGPGGDAWILRLDGDGNVLWQRAYGGIGDDFATSVSTTDDGGFIFSGYTASFGAAGDAWIVKLDASGNVVWQRALGGAGSDRANSVRTTDDGGYIVAGSAGHGSFGLAAPAPWVLKLDASGGIQGCASIRTSNAAATPGTAATATIATTSAAGSLINASGGMTSGPTSTAPSEQCFADAPGTPRSYQGLWWKAPAGVESGWGINFAHQGDVIFATWFTYDATGKALWLSMTAERTAGGNYVGTLYRTSGPAFSAVPFSPSAIVATPVGSGAVTFHDGNNGRFDYIVDGVSQSKEITRQVFGPAPTCRFGMHADLTRATNYQDLWWAAPAGVESGWGVNFSHQGDTIFATWFTYDADGTPMWLSATAPKTAPGTYAGTLYRTTGPPFNAAPFLPSDVTLTPVGTLTLTFADGNNATFAYTAFGVAQSKPITRQVFRLPGTACQ